MNLLSINKLTKTIGDVELFRDISFGLNEGEKIAIIGINGTGKTTLLRLILGLEESDSGEIAKNRILIPVYLSQNPKFNEDDTILEHIFKSNSPVIQLIKRYESICQVLNEQSNEDVQKEYDFIYKEMDRVNAWEYESQVSSILSELKINNLDTKMGELSGGMYKKVELVSCLINESNLLVLDEPTNHLDIDTIVWLESYLLETKKSIILITHDRYFLETIVNKIYEIADSRLYQYDGSYSYYLDKKSEIESSQKLQEEKIRSFLRTELEWLRRQPKARGTKQKARTERAETLIHRKVKIEEKDIELSVKGRRLGKKILELKNIFLSFNGITYINNFSYVFKKNERLGIVGPNGSGKSSLLNLITSRISVDSGHVQVGMNTAFGYFDQITSQLDEKLRVIEYIHKNSGEYIEIADGEKISAARVLERFLFTGSKQYSTISKLSGGERRRLYLVSILMQNPNFLILDEPTNDLDVKTLSILEDFLEDFNGTVLVVSHDRYFMDRVTDSLIIFDGDGNLNGFPGSYTEYLEFKQKNTKSEVQNKKSITVQTTLELPKEKTKLSYKEKKELESLETQIDQLEKEKKEIEINLTDNSMDYKRIQELLDRLEKIEILLFKKMKKWEELSNWT